MKIKMRTCLSGPTSVFKPGHEYDVESAFGEALCADGRAEPVEPVETKPAPKRRERTSRKPAAPNVERRG